MPWSQTTPMDQKTQFIADYASSPISATIRSLRRGNRLSEQKSVRDVPGLLCQLSPRPLSRPTRRFIVLVICTVAGRKGVAKGIKRLPRRDWRRVLGPRRIRRVFDKLHLVYVARAIRKDPGRRDANDEHGPRVHGTQGIIRRDTGRAVHANALGILEVQEQQPDVGVDEYVSPGSVHAVAVVIRNC